MIKHIYLLIDQIKPNLFISALIYFAIGFDFQIVGFYQSSPRIVHYYCF